MTETGKSNETVTEASTGLPVLPPWAAVLEVCVLVVLPGLLDYFVPGFPTLNESQPHFFWLPVLLLTLQYGSASGLLAAGVAILFSSTLGWPEQEIGENHFSYLLRIWLQPVLWIAAAVVLGQFRLRQIERKQSLARSVVRLTHQREELARYAQRLRERCDRLERVIATRYEGDALALMGALGRSQTGTDTEAARALHEAIAIAFGECRLSLLLIEGEQLRPALQHPEAPEADAKPIPLDGAFARTLTHSRQPFSVLTPYGEAALGGLGFAAAPVFGGGEIVGAVLLQECRPEVLDASVGARLAAVGLASAGLRQRRDVEESGGRNAPKATDNQDGDVARLPRWRRIRRELHRLTGVPLRSGRRA